jgi:hypothetical protein
MMRKSAALLAGLLSVAAPETRAENVSLGAYLLTARQDALLRARTSDRELDVGTYPGLPLIRDVEFKVRNEAFDPLLMRYTLRLEPRGLGEGRASRAYNETQLRHSRQRDRLLHHRALLERYLMAIELMENRAYRRLNAELIAVLEDRIKVLERLKSTEDFDLGDLVEAEADLTKLKSQDLELGRDIGQVEQRVASQLGRTTGPGDPALPDFDTTGMISVEEIIGEVERNPPVLDTQHVYLEYLKLSLDLAENRYRLEKAESRRYLTSLSFSYDVGERLDELERRDDRKDYDLAKAYILEAGFSLPFLSGGSQDLNRRKEDYLSEKEDYYERRREFEEILRKDLHDIQSLVGQYRYLKARETEVDAQASLKKYMQLSGIDPLLLLSIKEGHLKNRLKLEEARYGILLNWIKVLDASGVLSREPLRNHLAPGRPELKP